MADKKNVHFTKNPVTDSPNNEALEAIIELYYQLDGFITSSGKWFNTEKANYQDIDLLAVNATETHIVSVSTNLKEKVTVTRNDAEDKKFVSTVSYFENVESFLQNVKEYRWLKEERKVKKILACLNVPKNHVKQLEKLESKNIQLLTPSEFLPTFLQNKNLNYTKIQNPTLRLVQVLINAIKFENIKKSSSFEKLINDPRYNFTEDHSLFEEFIKSINDFHH